uniref:Uncharacterized protein n=1 Tax=Anguilla anguilla TaxID=7936 RepID=A0A0E9XCB9_ANGAN
MESHIQSPSPVKVLVNVCQVACDLRNCQHLGRAHLTSYISNKVNLSSGSSSLHQERPRC